MQGLVIGICGRLTKTDGKVQMPDSHR